MEGIDISNFEQRKTMGTIRKYITPSSNIIDSPLYLHIDTHVLY